MKKSIPVILAVCLLAFGLGGCGKQGQLTDGYYTAIQSEFSSTGWKEFVTICVSNGKIVTVEYNAKNASGFIKSWDIAYMEKMNNAKGTYPNRYTRTYAASFLNMQSVDEVETVSGASVSGSNFRKLAQALLEKAEAGDTSIAVVDTES